MQSWTRKRTRLLAFIVPVGAACGTASAGSPPADASPPAQSTVANLPNGPEEQDPVVGVSIEMIVVASEPAPDGAPATGPLARPIAVVRLLTPARFKGREIRVRTDPDDSKWHDIGSVLTAYISQKILTTEPDRAWLSERFLLAAIAYGHPAIQPRPGKAPGP